MRSDKNLMTIISDLEDRYYKFPSCYYCAELSRAINDLESISEHVDEEGRELLTKEEDNYVSDLIQKVLRYVDLTK